MRRIGLSERKYITVKLFFRKVQFVRRIEVMACCLSASIRTDYNDLKASFNKEMAETSSLRVETRCRNPPEATLITR